MDAWANPSPDPTTKQPPRRRRWIPLSLRFILVLLPLAGVVGFTWASVRGYRNAVAIREIERLGGEVRTRPLVPDVSKEIAAIEALGGSVRRDNEQPGGP